MLQEGGKVHRQRCGLLQDWDGCGVWGNIAMQEEVTFSEVKNDVFSGLLTYIGHLSPTHDFKLEVPIF